MFKGNPEGYSKKEVFNRLVSLIWPAMIEYLLMQLVGIFDQIQIGGLGDYAISGIGLANTVKLVFVTVFMAVNFGVTTLVAGSLGKNDQRGIAKSFLNGLYLTLILSVPGSIITYIFSGFFLDLFKAPDAISRVLASDYFKICVIGFVPVSLTTTCTAALRGVGDSKTPMVYNMTANFVNVFLNWVLINGKLGFPRLEVKGAAIATVISQVIAFIIAITACIKPNNKLHVKASVLKGSFSGKIFADLFRIGGPSMYEQFVARLGLSFFTMVVATQGTAVYASHTICMTIQSMTIIGGMALSLATTTTTGISLGENKKELAKYYTTCCVQISFVIAIIMGCIYGLLSRPILSLFTDSQETIDIGVKLLRICAFMQPFALVLYVFTGTLRGSGDALSIAKIATVSTFACRPLIAYLLVKVLGIGVKGAWYALFADQVIYSTLLFLRYKSEKWVLAFQKMKSLKQGA